MLPLFVLRNLGSKLIVVEREHMGGICLNWGCIPTKAMLRSSEVYHLMHRAKEFGLSAAKLTMIWMQLWTARAVLPNSLTAA